MKFSGAITIVRSDVHAKGQGQRSKVKVTEVNTQLSRFWTPTPVWIHIGRWNHAHSWKQHRRGALFFSRSSVKFQRHMALKIVELTQIGRFWTVTPVWMHKWLRNDAQSCKNRRRGDLLFFKVIRQISRSRGSENRPIWPRLGAFPDCNSSLNSPMATKWCTKLEVALKSCPIVFQSHPSNFKVTRF